MEDLLDKLKLLNYDQEFTKKSTSYKPLSKYSFSRDHFGYFIKVRDGLEVKKNASPKT